MDKNILNNKLTDDKSVNKEDKMLISSVNFVNRGRGEKYRREKSGELLKDKPQDLTYCRKQADKVSKLKQECTTNTESRLVYNRYTEIDTGSSRTSGYGSYTSVTSNDVTSKHVTSPTDRVSITTEDEYNIFIDPSFYFVTLRKQKQITKCSSFSRKVIETQKHINGGQEHKLQLCLTCEPNYFLVTNVHRELELKMFHDDNVTVEAEETLFTVFESATGQSFIQPSNHKGYYLHHLDGKLSVRKLELHLRPPEEYIFHVHSHGNTCLQNSEIVNLQLSQQSSARNNLSEQQPHSSDFTAGDDKRKLCHCGSVLDCKCHRTAPDNEFIVGENIYALSNLNKDVIKLGNACAADTDNVTLRHSAKVKAGVQGKRRSLYNVVSFTGSCFGFRQKSHD